MRARRLFSPPPPRTPLVAAIRGLFLVLPLVAGCGAAGAGGTRAAERARPAATVVFAAPPRSTLWLYPGVDDGAGWSCEGGRAEPVQVSSEGGFVVARLPARSGRQTWAIGEIATTGRGAERRLRPGASTKVPVFDAVPGKVTLVGGVRVLDVGEGLSLLPDPSATRARAARFLAHKDRRMAASIAEDGAGKMRWVALPDGCARR